MIVITGGAGFIGSYLQGKLRSRGEETVVSDWLGEAGKWRNLQRHAPLKIIPPESLESFLEENPSVTAIFHMGAVSTTTATDGDLVWQSNVELSQKLWTWCAQHGVRFIYASSAATYGAASRPEEFSDAPDRWDELHPLNLYGWSKHAFDQWVMHQLKKKAKAPPQWVGLKFFNVYGPNEYHKGAMISVVKGKYDEVRSGAPLRLFRSDVPGLPDGMQARDFIWVGDVVDVMLWLLDNSGVNGLFNCGTGVARTYLDLAHAVCDAAGVVRNVEFVDMPEKLRGQYQSYTCADMRRLKAAGYSRLFMSLEDGVAKYIKDYLSTPCPYY